MSTHHVNICLSCSLHAHGSRFASKFSDRHARLILAADDCTLNDHKNWPVDNLLHSPQRHMLAASHSAQQNTNTLSSPYEATVQNSPALLLNAVLPENFVPLMSTVKAKGGLAGAEALNLGLWLGLDRKGSKSGAPCSMSPGMLGRVSTLLEHRFVSPSTPDTYNAPAFAAELLWKRLSWMARQASCCTARAA